jgi:hypothetical protein
VNDALKSPPGRKPPPAEHQFLKGTSGNKRGRPKGSVDPGKAHLQSRAKEACRIDGKILRKTLLQLVIESTARQAAMGVPSMVALFAQIRAKVSPTQDEEKNGFMLAPADLPKQEFIAQEEARNANAQDPSDTDYVNHKVDEMCKAAKGIDSPLGEALLAFHRRWG